MNRSGMNRLRPLANYDMKSACSVLVAGPVYLALFVAAQHAAGQTNTLSSAERQFRTLLDTFNYSNRTAVLKFLEKEYPSRGPEEADEFLHFSDLPRGRPNSRFRA